jgi:hypothetical protein
MGFALASRLGDNRAGQQAEAWRIVWIKRFHWLTGNDMPFNTPPALCE